MKKQHQKSKEPEKKDLKDIEEEIVVEQEQEIDIIKKQADEYLEGWKRCQADFENYKKRQTESQKDMMRYAAEGVVMEIIPVLDNFHMSTMHIPEDQKDNPWVTGIMYIQKQLETVLGDNGVEEIDPKIGDTFDPMFHEAIEKGDSSEGEEKKEIENKISKVVLKGYKMGEKVIRAARVVVE